MADYIDREGLLQIESLLKTGIIENNKVAIWLYEQIMHDIEAYPSEDVAPVIHARWIKCFDARKVLNCHSGTAFKCSHCSRRAGHKQIKFYDFCPKCGAIMDAEEDG